MSGRGWAAFAAMSLIWGVPYLFIKVAVDDGVSPVFLSFARVALGAALLLAISWRAGVLGQLRGRWRWIAAYAVIEIALPFPLIVGHLCGLHGLHLFLDQSTEEIAGAVHAGGASLLQLNLHHASRPEHLDSTNEDQGKK